MNNKKLNRPPRIAQWLLKYIFPDRREYTSLGDFEEVYNQIAEGEGVIKARLWFWAELIKSLPGFFKNQIYWGVTMFKNYFKIALRNIIKQKGYSFINIFGLAIGMAVCILILLWVLDELSYDKFNVNANELYHVSIEDHRTDKVTRFWNTPIPLGPVLEKEVPGIIHATRYNTRPRTMVKYGEKIFNERLGFADPSIFKMFTFIFIKGNPDRVFADPYSTVITEEMAGKIFGDKDPIEKTLRINNKFNIKITGVIKNIPHNSQLRFNFLTQFTTIKEFIDETRMKNWRNFSIDTFVLLHKNAGINDVNKKIEGFLLKKSTNKKVKLFLRPVIDMHLYSLEGGGRITYVYIFSLIALFVLIIACINFINLSTARAGIRAMELGLRKVVGANRRQIIEQFLGESIFLSFIALFVALLLVKLFLPAFEVLSGRPLSMDLLNGKIILVLIGIFIATGTAAGIYPALFLSSFKPAKVLKGEIKPGSSWLRKVLVVTQFSLSIILIICTIVISNQVEYLNNKPLGFDRNNLVYIRINGAMVNNYESIRGEFLQNRGIKNVTMTSDPLGVYASASTSTLDWEGKSKNDSMNIKIISVNYDFMKTFNLEMVEGREFSRKFPSDSSNYIVNKEALKRMGMKSPIGKRFTMSGMEGTIIGVVKDFNFESLYNEVEPLLFFFYPGWYSHIVVKIGPGNISNTINFLKRTVKKFAPAFPFEYRFLDDYFENQYRSEKRMKELINYFAILAIFISCLGLVGLASFTAQRRTKEIGIRKVLGASGTDVTLLLSKEFTRWVLLANLFAWPVAYFIMNKWLQSFAYRTGLGLHIFIFSAVITLLIALLTVSYQSIKASITNPVDALKY